MDPFHASSTESKQIYNTKPEFLNMVNIHNETNIIGQLPRGSWLTHLVGWDKEKVQ